MTAPKDPVKAAEYKKRLKEIRSTPEYRLDRKVYCLLLSSLGIVNVKSQKGVKRSWKLNQAVPTKCGICNQIFPTRSEMCKHKYDVHGIPKIHSGEKVCRTCGKVFSSNSTILSHKLLVHRDEFFKGIKSGPKLGAKFKTEHKHKISKALRIFYGSYDPNIPLGPIILSNPQAVNERWCHDYERWMTAVKKRDGYKCQHCGKGKEAYLIAHHIKPYNEFVESRYDVDNGITLCMSCHMKEEARMRKLRKECALFLYQLLLFYKDLPNHLEIILGTPDRLALTPIMDSFRRSIQKKHSHLSNIKCYALASNFRIEGEI